MKQKKIEPFLAEEILAQKNIRIFRGEEFRRLFGLSASRAKYFLETYARKGLLLRLKKDVYSLKSRLPGEEEIANALYRPSYISLEYALAKYGIIPEMVYTVTSVTTKPTRRFTALSREYAYLGLKKTAFTGYTLKREGGRSYLMAEPEKALADYLYFVSLGRKNRNERLRTTGLSRKKILAYAALFGRPSLLKSAGNI